MANNNSEKELLKKYLGKELSGFLFEDDDVEILSRNSDVGGEGTLDNNLDLAVVAKNTIKTKKVMTPREMVKELDKTVIGQDETKKVLAVEFYKHIMRIKNKEKLEFLDKNIKKSNILLTGKSGCGKTFICEELSRILGIDCLIYDTSALTSSGYVGKSVEDIFNDLIVKCERNLERIENAVIVLDEIDKKRSHSSERDTADVAGSKVVMEMLKMLEGTEMNVKGITINTKNILFIGCGSFMGTSEDSSIEEVVRRRLKEGKKVEESYSIGFGRTAKSKTPVKELTDEECRSQITKTDIVAWGMLPELVGRFDIVSNLKSLTIEDYINIAKNRIESIDDNNGIFDLLDKKLTVKEEVVEAIANKAFRDRDMGARIINGIFSEIISNVIYEIEDEIAEYVVDLEYIEKLGIIEKEKDEEEA